MSATLQTFEISTTPPAERALLGEGVGEAVFLAARGRDGLGGPVRLTLVAKPGAAAADRLSGLAARPTWRLEARAPRVFALELPGPDFGRFLAEAKDAIERIETGGRVFGERVEVEEQRAQVRFVLRDRARKGDLTKLGVKAVSASAGEGEVRAEVRGADLAGLALAPFVGPVEVERVEG